MIKFSIIVPVYNVEIYLKDCIESILKQTFENYEILLIDDGSTDRSGLICDEYVSLYPRITVIHKENGGLSDARNVGIEKAKGEYLVFIDSDDYIENGTLDKFNKKLEKSNNPDVLITRIKKIFEETNKIKYMDEDLSLDLINNCPKNEIIDCMFTESNSLWPAVRYIVKRSLIESKNLKFAVGYLHEDLDWTSKLFLNAETYTGLNFYWYNHRIGRQGSITTNNTNAKRTLDVIELVFQNIKDTQYNKLDVEVRKIMYQRMVKSLFSSLSNYMYYDDEEKKKIINSLNYKKNVFMYAVVFRHKLFVAFSNIFGYKVALHLMHLLHKTK